MKTRSQLTATELESLYKMLDVKLGSIGVETQPQVAAKLLQLVGNPDAGLKRYSDVIRPDSALTGRVLKLANSAYFAQVKPVTSLDRSCVLLGLERLKAVALGFQLSRAAAAGAAGQVSRRVWGESVFRACLCSELTRKLYPGLAAEAFVVGLMMDAGTPLLHRLLGPPAEKIILSGEPPLKRFRAEFNTLPFTHVDVAAVLMRRWKLPDTLARPVEWHHTPPGDTERTGSVHVLHRVAYYVGALRLDSECRTETAAPLANIAQSVLGMPSDALARSVKHASGEYGAILEMFKDVAEAVADLPTLADRVHTQLISAVDDQLASQIRTESAERPARFVVGVNHIEVETDSQGKVVAFIRDAKGERLLSYTFERGATTGAVLEALGVDPEGPEQAAELDTYLRQLAA